MKRSWIIATTTAMAMSFAAQVANAATVVDTWTFDASSATSGEEPSNNGILLGDFDSTLQTAAQVDGTFKFDPITSGTASDLSAWSLLNESIDMSAGYAQFTLNIDSVDMSGDPATANAFGIQLANSGDAGDFLQLNFGLNWNKTIMQFILTGKIDGVAITEGATANKYINLPTLAETDVQATAKLNVDAGTLTLSVVGFDDKVMTIDNDLSGLDKLDRIRTYQRNFLGAGDFIVFDSITVEKDASVQTEAEYGYAEVWDMDDNGQFQLSTNGTSLGSTFDTNNNSITQIDDDGTFIFSPTSVSGNDTILLSTPIVLTNGATSKVKLSYDLSSVDFSVDPATRTTLDVILMDSASSDSLTIRLLDVNTGDTLRGQVYLREAGTIPNLFLGNQDVSPTLSLSAPASISVELDYEAGSYAWDINGVTGTGAVDLSGLGINRFDSLKIYYNTWSNSTDQAVLDSLKVETFGNASSGPHPLSAYVINYQMDDNIGTTPDELAQTGNDYLGQFNTVPGPAADGAGNLFVTNATAAVQSMKHIFDSVRTNGVFVAEWRLSEWDFSTAVDGKGVKVGLFDASHALYLEYVADNVNGHCEIRSWQSGDPAFDFGNTTEIPLVSDGTGVVIQAEFNLDDLTYTVSWKFDTDAAFTTFVNAKAFNAGFVDKFDAIELRPGDGTQTASIDYITVTDPNPPEASPGAMYLAWLTTYSELGTATNLTDNPDGDMLDNLAEYALGGNPVDGADTGIGSVVGTAVDGGTNYLEYVHAIRDDADARGLTYYLESDENLIVAPGWVSAVYEIVGTNLNYEVSGFDSVTNRIPTDAKDQQFLKLKVESFL
ncbi:hypothetical protein [Pontiella sulfatireligans]|uniref:Uncharacterized protein n=1 Tax=Pontiella sulfatireligans TaxID=2750658 RepID=A0A6C2UP44_9BACT|nr:hypothetical protein [Pontiella sulfatireligans]VGO20796.1 hypothetical protein SCARR_02863 [Pontiella sulfatireligans]